MKVIFEFDTGNLVGDDREIMQMFINRIANAPIPESNKKEIAPVKQVESPRVAAPVKVEASKPIRAPRKPKLEAVPEIAEVETKETVEDLDALSDEVEELGIIDVTKMRDKLECGVDPLGLDDDILAPAPVKVKPVAPAPKLMEKVTFLNFLNKLLQQKPNTRATIIKLFERYGAKTAAEVPADKYAEIVKVLS